MNKKQKQNKTKTKKQKTKKEEKEEDTVRVRCWGRDVQFYGLGLWLLTTVPKFSGERVLIAGGTGIVGFGIVQAMLKQGTKVSNSFTDILMEGGTGSLLYSSSTCANEKDNGKSQTGSKTARCLRDYSHVSWITNKQINICLKNK